MPTMNQWTRGEWTNLGADAEIGSLTAPLQTTYVNPIYDSNGTAADVTQVTIYDSTAPGQSGVASWSAGFIYCSAPFRILARGNTDANSAVFVFPAGVHKIFNPTVGTYSATPATYISGSLVAITAIYLYQSGGSVATWRIVLAD